MMRGKDAPRLVKYPAPANDEEEYPKKDEKELTETWQEIVDTATNGDPEYSFRLFRELIVNFDQDRKKFYDELLNYIKELKEKQGVINTVHLRTVINMLEEIKPHYLKEENKND